MGSHAVSRRKFDNERWLVGGEVNREDSVVSGKRARSVRRVACVVRRRSHQHVRACEEMGVEGREQRRLLRLLDAAARLGALLDDLVDDAPCVPRAASRGGGGLSGVNGSRCGAIPWGGWWWRGGRVGVG